jgi:hypothetical protein
VEQRVAQMVGYGVQPQPFQPIVQPPTYQQATASGQNVYGTNPLMMSQAEHERQLLEFMRYQDEQRRRRGF